MKQPIRIFVTGGTFDKEYNERNGSLYFKDTHLREMLQLGRCRVDVEVCTCQAIESEVTSFDLSKAPRGAFARWGSSPP